MAYNDQNYIKREEIYIFYLKFSTLKIFHDLKKFLDENVFL